VEWNSRASWGRGHGHLMLSSSLRCRPPHNLELTANRPVPANRSAPYANLEVQRFLFIASAVLLVAFFTAAFASAVAF
jgi:hypothetical protein